MATTADGWSAAGRSFLGVTVHFICPRTRERKSLVLACRAMTQKHTFSYLAELLTDVHKNFEIADKVVRTTTDNAANFCKAFRMFARRQEGMSTTAVDDEVNDAQLDAMPVRTATGMEVVDSIALDADEVAAIDDIYWTGTRPNPDEDHFVDLDNVLTEVGLEERVTYSLPPHARCAAHTLNLVASVDIERARVNQTGALAFPKEFTTATVKAMRIWQLHARSDAFKAKIKKIVGTRLKVPVVTRWNSTYDSLKCINHILSNNQLM